MAASCVPLRWKPFLGSESVSTGQVRLSHGGNGMKNLLRLASYTSSVLNPQEALGFGLEVGSLESRVQESDWTLVVGWEGDGITC